MPYTSTQSQHTVTAHSHSTRSQHTVTAHGHSIHTQHTDTAHSHSTQEVVSPGVTPMPYTSQSGSSDCISASVTDGVTDAADGPGSASFFGLRT